MSEPFGESTARREAARFFYWVQKARAFVALVKPLQTILLLTTGFCAYVLSLPTQIHWIELVGGGLALLWSISGCTALNMLLDRDIDQIMMRTAGRPLPLGTLTPRSAHLFGIGLSLAGLLLAWLLSPLFGGIVTLGFFTDLVVYTLWLKRRTPLSIFFGGISGGMPALAGRALAIGSIDTIGLLLAAGVLFWIPSHILTLVTHHAEGYCVAGVPVWPNVYGQKATRRVIAVTTILDAIVLMLAGWLLGIHPIAMGILAGLGIGLSGLSILVLVRATKELNWTLFKFASIYMLAAFVSLTLGTVI